MQLISIYIRKTGGEMAGALPSTVEENIRSLRELHPLLAHKLYSGDEVADFIATKFPREVMRAYLALRPLAYKADLARYCLLYEMGGIYADLSYYFVRPLPINEKKAVVFRDFLSCSPWDTSNGVIAAPPKHKALLRSIELVCENVRRAYYGMTPLCPTGPVLFGKALAQTCEAEDLKTGSAIAMPSERLRELMPNFELPGGTRIHCLATGREIAAIKRKKMHIGSLEDLGITDSDRRYSEYWRERSVYISEGAVD